MNVLASHGDILYFIKYNEIESADILRGFNSEKIYIHQKKPTASVSFVGYRRQRLVIF